MPKDLEGRQRLRAFVVGVFPYLETGSAVKKAIRKNQILINGEVGETGSWVKASDQLTYKWMYALSNKKRKEVEIYYQDNDLLIVRKPPGLATSGNINSLQSHLESYSIEESELTLPFPYLVHRLDKATEGVMIAAKTMTARRLLGQMISDDKFVKHYIMIVQGKMDLSQKIIDFDLEGKLAKTEILSLETLDTKDACTRAIVKIKTGRTHQIRKHFQMIGHPIVGDKLYNKEGISFGTGLLLCAYYLHFPHPITNETIEISCPIPTKISKYRIR